MCNNKRKYRKYKLIQFDDLPFKNIFIQETAELIILEYELRCIVGYIIKSVLTDKEYAFIAARYGFERMRSMEELSKIYGVSRQWLYIWEKKILKKLRRYIKSTYPILQV